MRRSGFTLVEVVLAVALAAVVMGSGTYLYVSGSQQFVKITDHNTFRDEGMLVLETINRDLQQIVVSEGKWPDGKFYMIEPYKLVDKYTQNYKDPITGQIMPYTDAGTGVKFFRYHHTEMAPRPGGAAGQIPRVVAQELEYKTVPVDASDPSKGLNITRNGEVVNTLPMSEVIFQKLPASVAFDQVQGSPHAILKVIVIPQGGMWRQMTKDTIDALKARGSTVLHKIYHLSGYESQYSSLLFKALQQNTAHPGTFSSPVLEAVFNDAQANAGADSGMLNTSSAVGQTPSQSYDMPAGVVRMDTSAKWKLDGAYKDPFFATGEGVPGPAGSFPPCLTYVFRDPVDPQPQPNHCPAIQNH
jgi:prepilin-type N-terminal cleavage/methylation domain-containing protein